MSKESRLNVIREELAAGDVFEQPLVEHVPSRKAIRGYCATNGVVTVNPIPDVLDTLIHELFHRRYPSWSERTVKGQTTRLIRSLTPEEQQALYDLYQSKRKRVRRKKAVQ